MDARFADVPDRLWRRVAPLLPAERPKPKGGRPPLDNRRVLAGVLYRLRTGCQWKALPREFGSGSACHARFQQWVEAGVFGDIFTVCLQYYDARRGIAWTWASLDAALIKAPKGGSTRARTRPIAANAAVSATW